MNEKDKKKAINCRFQPTESDQFFKWLNNQSNMTIAIRNLIYHAIDLYGTSDFLAPDIQKEVMRNTFIFEASNNKKIAPVNPFSEDTDNEIESKSFQEDNKNSVLVNENKDSPLTNKEPDAQGNKPLARNDFYGDVDIDKL